MSKKTKTLFFPITPQLPAVMPQFHAGPVTSNYPNEPHAKRLMQMFTYKRPYLNGQGRGYREFIDDFILPVARAAGLGVEMDAMHNVYIDLRSDETHRTMFTAHTDSVHREEGRQSVAFDPETGLISVLDGSCLGADDAAGVALMLHMIECGVPGMYVFPAGEEVGGIGARYIADDVEFLSQFDRAIAFDRRGDYSVITHQMGGRCCSDEFALALSEALDSDALMFSPDQTGTYTDTAEFTGVIPECTNLSIGYMSEHTSRETMSLYYFQALAEKIVQVDFDALPIVRDPTEVDDDEDWWYGAKRWSTPEMEYEAQSTDEYLHFDAMAALDMAYDGDFDELVSLMLEQMYPADEVHDRRASVVDSRITLKLLDDVEEELYSHGAYAAMEFLHDTIVIPTYH